MDGRQWGQRRPDQVADRSTPKKNRLLTNCGSMVRRAEFAEPLPGSPYEARTRHSQRKQARPCVELQKSRPCLIRLRITECAIIVPPKWAEARFRYRYRYPYPYPYRNRATRCPLRGRARRRDGAVPITTTGNKQHQGESNNGACHGKSSRRCAVRSPRPANPIPTAAN
jgi:hypothetical protein